MKYYFKCPKCGCDDGFTVPSEQSSDLGCLLLFFGGFIPALLYADTQSHRVQCDHCGYIFRQPALPKTGAAKLATAILVAYILAFTVAMTLIRSPDLAKAVPLPQFVQDLASMISEHSGAFILLVGATGTATLFICLIASAASSIAHRRRLSREFELRPKRRAAAANRRESGPTSSEDAPCTPPNDSSP